MAKKEKTPNEGKAQKPIFKKWWFWVIVILVLGGIGSVMGGGSETTDPDSSQPSAQTQPETQSVASEPQETAPTETTPETESQEPAESPDLEAAREALDDVLGSTTFYENVRNDVTGKWRVLVFYSSENIVDHAVEYYNAYYSSDDEIHMVVNLGLKTTSALSVSNGIMYLDVHEYIDGEEHDAKVLGGGDLLKSYTIDLNTGEIEDLSDAAGE